MKQLAILFAAVCTIGMMTSEASAQRHHHGHRGGHHGNFNRGGGFSISIGNGFNGLSYSNLRPSFGYGGYRPVYRPVYGGGFGGGYGGGFYGRPVYNSGLSIGIGGGGFGGYRGGYRGCGGW